VVKQTVQNKGKIIIPAFAVGRTQEIIYMYNRMVREGVIRHIPVFVDSPLAVSATDIFRMYPQYFDEEAKKFFADAVTKQLYDGVTYTRSVEESKAINEMSGPLMIISASGMAETGRILHHLKNNIEDSRNTILIVGWQAPDTLGRRLADREKRVRIFGEEYTRRAEVVTIGGLSAHAGQDMLISYAQASQASLRELILIHGEERGAEPFMEKLKELNFENVAYPKYQQTFEI
jgi:metallo-beta-lactamase family protein